MDFVANGSKNVEIETSTGVYLRHAIQTHFVEIGEDYIELVNRYVKPLYEEGDLLSSISDPEKRRDLRYLPKTNRDT